MRISVALQGRGFGEVVPREGRRVGGVRRHPSEKNILFSRRSNAVAPHPDIRAFFR